LQNLGLPKENKPSTPQHHNGEFRVVAASSGSAWLKDAYRIFKLSKGVWFGIGAFLLVASLVPILSTFVVILMPVLVGGLMIGCSQINATNPMKFDYLFSGLRKSTRPLLMLSLVNVLTLILVTTLTSNISMALGFDLSTLVPEHMEGNQNQQVIAWLQNLDPVIFIQTFLVGLSVFLILMLPVFMAFWFAPALICLKNKSVALSLKQSFSASLKNKVPFMVYSGVAVAYLFLFFFLLTLVAAIAQPLTIPLVLVGYVGGFSISLISIYTSFVEIFPDHSSDDRLETHGNDTSSNDGKDDSSMLA